MFLYRIFSVLLFPVIDLYLIYRVIKKKEDKSRLRERFGRTKQIRPEGDIIWLHAVSVGEANSSLVLVDDLLEKFPQATVLFTTTTLTSALIIASKIPNFNGRVIHQFLPIDSYYCVQNFFDFWQPKAAIFVESEIWPNLIDSAYRRGIETFLVNARMSEKSAKKWRISKRLGFKIFDSFSTIFAQTNDDKKRFEQLTKHEVLFYGNLKSQARNLDFNSAELEKIKSQIGSRKFWLAASTHKGEEEAVLFSHNELKKTFPDLLTILVPRHPNRADEIKSLIGSANIAQRSQKQNIENSTEFYLADTLGELGIFYRLASFTFIGGSLLEIGGHNPFEAIKLGCVVMSGRKVFNFKEIYETLESEKACIMIDSKEQLAAQVKEFLQNENVVKAMSEKAFKVIGNADNIAGKITNKISELLIND